MRLDHPQLSPDVNRYRRVPGGLADLPRTPHQLVQPPRRSGASLSHDPYGAVYRCAAR